MVLTVKNPFTDDETRAKPVEKIIEDIIESNWDAVKTTVNVDDVAFGFFGNKILQSGKEITLRAYSIFEDLPPIDITRNRREYFHTLIIDIYVLSNERDDQRDPRAIAIMKWLDELFIIIGDVSQRGIYEMNYRGARMDPDPESSNITRVKAMLDLRYILDKVEV